MDSTAKRKSRLQAEAEHLRGRYGEVKFDKDDGAWFYVSRLKLPGGWNKRDVEVLIDIPWGNPGYPSVAPTWFWTDKELRTSTGQKVGHFFTEGSSHSDRMHLDDGWGHFCIHLKDWRPASGFSITSGHWLLTYLQLIETAFADQKGLNR